MGCKDEEAIPQRLHCFGFSHFSSLLPQSLVHIVHVYRIDKLPPLCMQGACRRLQTRCFCCGFSAGLLYVMQEELFHSAFFPEVRPVCTSDTSGW